MKRRHFLHGTLALPWLAGCFSNSQRLQGSIVGANFRLGHRLRPQRVAQDLPREVALTHQQVAQPVVGRGQ